MTKLRHYDNEGTARFVTFSTYRRTNCLLESGVPELLIDHLQSVRTRHEIKFFGYVIMPEHVHLVLLPPGGTKLGLVIREIKSKMAREYFAKMGAPQLVLNESGAPQLAVGNSRPCKLFSGCPQLPEDPSARVVGNSETAQHVFWQKRCYDHNCRSAATVREKIDYCHMNPVK